MSNPSPTEQLSPSDSERIAGLFTRLGWIGFWLQAALASLPIIMFIYVVIHSSPSSPAARRFDLREYAAFGSLLVLLFTMFWSYRYTRLAKRMLSSDPSLPSSSIIRSVWTGVRACCLGGFISLLLLIGSVGRLLFLFMNAPQGGMQVIQTSVESRAKWVSTIDMVDLLAMVSTLTAELIVLVFSLWLLHRMLRCTASHDQTSDA